MKIVEWSDEDGCVVGSCLGLFYGGCHGDDEKAVFAELRELVEETIELYAKDGKPLPPPTSGKDSTTTRCCRSPLSGKSIGIEITAPARFSLAVLNRKRNLKPCARDFTSTSPEHRSSTYPLGDVAQSRIGSGGGTPDHKSAATNISAPCRRALGTIGH